MSQKFKPTMIAAALTAALSGGAMAQYVTPVSGTSTVNGTSGGTTTEIMNTTVIDVGLLPVGNPGKAGGTGHYYGTLTQAQESDKSGSNLLVSGEGATVITGWNDGGTRTVSLVVNGNSAAGSGTSITGGLTVNNTIIHGVSTGSVGTDAVNVTQLNAAISGITPVLQTSLNTGSGTTISGDTVAATNGNFTTSNSTTISNSGATSTGSLAVTNNATVGGTLGVTGLSTLGAVTQVGTANINATGSAATTIGASSNTSAVSLTSGASSIVTSNGTNTVIGNTNAMTASAGNNNITASAVNNIEAPTNNIGVTTSNSINTVGNISTGTTVTERGGNTTLSLVNNTASLTAGSTLATNGISGTTSGIGSGGLTVYNSALTIANGTTIPTASSPNGILAGNTYQNKINGNLLVDGNVYINGTLNYVSSNSANTSVVGSTAAGTAASILSGANTPTSGGTAIVLKGATGTQTVVDANGKLTNVVGTAAQSTAALTLTNGIGNTHGLVITEAQATLSGGTHSSSLSMGDNGGTFSDSASGAPVQVHGVNDGTNDFDAVNVRQFSGAIASVTAMANIPQVDQDKTYAVGVGMGSFMGKTALAAGVTYRFTRNGVFKGSLSSAMGSSNTTTMGVGAAWSY